MKKLTLTFCALFAFVSALYAGTEKYSGKEKEVMQPAPPVCELYRAHEWDLDIWGTYVFSANPGRNHIDNDDPFTPDLDPFISNGGSTMLPAYQEPEAQNPNEHVNLGQESKDKFLGKDNAFGGGVDVKYFWSRYFGAGIEGFDVDAHENGGGVLGTLTVRYPWGRFGPYAWGGAGALFGGGALYHFFSEKHTYAGGFVANASPEPHPPTGAGEREFWTNEVVPNRKARFLGQLGVGLEFRVTCHIGLMADFAWNFVAGSSESGDKFHPIVEEGFGVTTFNGNEISRVPITNTAVDLHPGTGSDDQDFGMVRFGVTFSY